MQVIPLNDYLIQKHKDNFLNLELDFDADTAFSIEVVRTLRTYFTDCDLLLLNIKTKFNLSLVESLLSESIENSLNQNPIQILVNGPNSNALKLEKSLFANEEPSNYWVPIYNIYKERFPQRAFYENADAIEAYFFDKTKVKELSIMASHDDLLLALFMKHKGYKSVLDLGCGAGLFYHLARSILGPDSRYKGYDLSRTQILNAKKNYPTHFFDVKDNFLIPQDEISQYEIVHAYSVFAFMDPEQAMVTIKRILDSKACFFTRISVTQDGCGYYPSFFYNPPGHHKIDDRQVYTSCFFPKLSQIEALLNRYEEKYIYEIEDFINKPSNPLLHRDGMKAPFILPSFNRLRVKAFGRLNRIMGRGPFKTSILRIYPREDYQVIKKIESQIKHNYKQEYLKYLTVLDNS